MITNCRFSSFKDINLRKSVPFIVVGAIVLGFALVTMYPPGVLFGLFVVYSLSGYVTAALRLLRRKPAASQ
jgi:CDP-diacylglycerol--serine O-phosphatidyltransferase